MRRALTRAAREALPVLKASGLTGRAARPSRCTASSRPSPRPGPGRNRHRQRRRGRARQRQGQVAAVDLAAPRPGRSSWPPRRWLPGCRALGAPQRAAPGAAAGGDRGTPPRPGWTWPRRDHRRAARFLAGEESALASRISGEPAMPRFKPPRVSSGAVVGPADAGAQRGNPGPHRPDRRYGRPGSVGRTPGEPGACCARCTRPTAAGTVVETGLGTPCVTCFGSTAPSRCAARLPRAWVPRRDAARMTSATRTSRPPGPLWAPGSLWPCRPLLRDRGDRAGRPVTCAGIGRPVGPCFTACAPHRRRPWTRWPAPGQSRGGHGRDPLGPAWSRAAAPATTGGTTRFVRSALQVFREEIRSHSPGGAWTRRGQPFLAAPAGRALDAADWSLRLRKHR